MKNPAMIVTAAALGVLAITQPATAFNPQPDPPGIAKSQAMQKVNPAPTAAMGLGGGKLLLPAIKQGPKVNPAKR